MTYVLLCTFSGIAGGFVGKVKGSSFWLWFAIAAVLPFIGIVAAMLYRVDRDELRRQCPTCGKVIKLHDQVCTRCGTDLDFPEAAIVPESQARGTLSGSPAGPRKE